MPNSVRVMINGQTRLSGVIGWPVAHTLSPVMQNAALAKRGINAIYVPLGVPESGLKPLMASLRALNALGVNVTIPYKEKVMRLLDEVAPSAQRIGAVNTIVQEQGRLIGHNTDGVGFLACLKGSLNLKGKNAVLIGAGGAGRAVAVSLALAGVARLTLTDTDPKRLKAVLAHLTRQGCLQGVGVQPGSESLRAALAEADLLVNATPLGLKPRDPLPIPPGWMIRHRCVMDLVYGPGMTPFLAEAHLHKNEIIPGWLMLLHQGAESFRLWTGQTAPVDVMRKALVKAAGLKEV